MTFTLLIIVFICTIRIYRGAVLCGEAFRAYTMRASSWACFVALTRGVRSFVEIKIAKILGS